MGSAFIKMNEDGSFNLNIGATDLGTGSDTILAQIAAETLTVSPEKFIVYSSDTDLTPFDVGAYASSTTYVSGEAVRKTADQIKQQILLTALDIFQEENPQAELQELTMSNGVVHFGKKQLTFAEIGTRSLYMANQEQIAAIASHVSSVSPPPFAAHFAEVEVNERTGEYRLLDYVAAVDCGTIINPLFAEGQVEGAIANGIGFALTEEYLFRKSGQMLNADFKFYRLPAIGDIPPIRVILVPTHEPTGPYGAKSIAEIGVSGPLPAIANAIYNAVGVRLKESPITAEKIFWALKKK